MLLQRALRGWYFNLGSDKHRLALLGTWINAFVGAICDGFRKI